MFTLRLSRPRTEHLFSLLRFHPNLGFGVQGLGIYREEGLNVLWSVDCVLKRGLAQFQEYRPFRLATRAVCLSAMKCAGSLYAPLPHARSHRWSY